MARISTAGSSWPRRRKPNADRAHWTPNPNPSGDEDLAVLAGALAHPARIEVIRYLQRRGKATVGEIVDHLGIVQGTTSYHLNVLERAKLLTCHEDRPRMWYSVRGHRLDELEALMRTLRVETRVNE